MSLATGSSRSMVDYKGTLHHVLKRYKVFNAQENEAWESVLINDTKCRNGTRLWKNREILTVFKAELVLSYDAQLPTDLKCLFNTADNEQIWSTLIESRSMVSHLDENTNIYKMTLNDTWTFGQKQFECIERVTKHRGQCHYIACSLPTNWWFAFTISQTKDKQGTIQLYFEQDEKLAIEQSDQVKDLVLALISRPIDVLETCGVPPRVAHVDSGISVLKSEYKPLERSYELLYDVVPPEQEELSSSVDSISIQRPSVSGDRARPWHSQSWERDRTAGLHMILPRASPFMPSSPFIPSSRYVRKTANLTSSYPETRRTSVEWQTSTMDDEHDEDIMSRLIVVIDGDKWAPSASVDVQAEVAFPGMNLDDCSTIANVFAQNCVKCCQHRDYHSRYLILISHPAQLSQLLQQKDHSGKDDIDGTDVQVKLTIRPSSEIIDNAISVNNQPIQIESWIDLPCNLDNDSNSDNSDGSDNEVDENSGSDDVFANDMEGLQIPVKLQPLTDPPGFLPEKENPKRAEPIPDKVVHAEEKVSELHDDNFIRSIHVPESDPEPLKKVHTYFCDLLRKDNWELVQKPQEGNGSITVKTLDVPGHPTGAIFGQISWSQSSIWDVKAVVECVGCRKSWDSSFDQATFIDCITSTCSKWHYQLKGSWPASPRDFALLIGRYNAEYQADICATSCASEEGVFNSLATSKESTGIIRAHADIAGWHLEQTDINTTSVIYITQIDHKEWLPVSLLSRTWPQRAVTLRQMYSFFNQYGAPPNLCKLSLAKMCTLTCDLNHRSLRCEYMRPRDLPGQSNTCTQAQFRLDCRRWSRNGQYTIVVDPPPSRTYVQERPSDPFGYWVTVEHEEDFIIPQCGKILVLVKPGRSPGVHVNGIQVSVTKDDQLHIPGPAPFSSSKSKEETLKTGINKALAFKPLDAEQRSELMERTEKSVEPLVDLHTITPQQYAQAALVLLKQLEAHFGWTTVSDKNGIRTWKRVGKPIREAATSDGGNDKDTAQAGSFPAGGASEPLDMLSEESLAIPEPFTMYKTKKVIEGFSLEEVASVVTSIGSLRKVYDETLEDVQVVHSDQPGCSIAKQVIKAMFPFKSRETYVCSCTANEKIVSETNPAAMRILYVERSILPLSVLKKGKLPVGHVYISGWILEAIDPYTTATNHPIPSMQATYIAALNLGSSVPAYISNLVVSGWMKKIQWVESFLKARGPPPYSLQPMYAAGWKENKVVSFQQLGAEDSLLDWKQVQTNYAEKTRELTLSASFAFKSPPSTLDLKTALRSPSLDSLPSTPRLGRRTAPSSLTALVDGAERGTALPSPLLPGKTRTTSGMVGDILLLTHLILDLQTYPAGYEFQVYLNQCAVGETTAKRSMNGRLLVQVTELTPQPSQMIGGKIKPKHAIRVRIPQSRLITANHDDNIVYDFGWSLCPVRDEAAPQGGTRLTVSGVLGEEDDRWQGRILVNGKVATLGSDIEIPPSADPALVTPPPPPSPSMPGALDDEILLASSSSSHPNTADTLAETPYSSASGMMAAAIGGVNDLRERVMMPFRAASQSFLSTRSDDSQVASPDTKLFEGHLSGIPSSSHTTQRGESSQSQPDTWSQAIRMGLVIIIILLCLVLVLVLLVLPTLVRRWLSSQDLVVMPDFIATLSHSDQDWDSMTLRHLLQFPWFGGWELQIVAVRRHHYV